MKRRAFIALLGGTAAALSLLWPVLARAQQPAMPVIGFLGGASAELFVSQVRAFRQGLSETGHAEGRNVTIEFRWAEGRYDRLPDLAADLVRRRVTVLATSGGEPPALAAQEATTTIPIVFVTSGDPVAAGYVASLSRPGGNLTGGGLVIGNDAFFIGRSKRIAALTLRHAVPAIFQFRDFAAAGGLVSYGGDFTETYRLAGVYAGRILKGEQLADLPVQQVTKVRLIINLATGKRLGLTIPLPLIGRADEVIE